MKQDDDDRDKSDEEFDAEIKEARRRRFAEQQAATPGSLLQYDRPKRRRRPRRRPVIDTLPGGGDVFGDVLPVPAREEPESNVVPYSGMGWDWTTEL